MHPLVQPCLYLVHAEVIDETFPKDRSQVAELSTLNYMDQFETTNGARLFPFLGAANPTLLRKRVVENSNVAAYSDVDDTQTADNPILFVGDWSNYVILDRVGMSIEYIPHLFNTTSNRPDGTRAWYAFWRVGADSINDGGIVVMNIATTA